MAFQEQVFLFFEMLKVYFPGGDQLYAPKKLQEIEKAKTIAVEESNAVSIRLLSRIFSLVSLSQAGVNISNKKLETLQNIS